MYYMFWFILLTISVLARGRCVWRPPVTMFPERLLHIKVDGDFFTPRRHLASAITVVNGKVGGITPVLDPRTAGHPNAVSGTEHHRTQLFSGGLNHHGAIHFSIVFDKHFAIPDMLYSIVDVNPDEMFSPVPLDAPGPDIEIVRFERHALRFVDIVRIGVGVRSPCLPEREVGRVYYEFNVTATYDLYHSYNNTLVADDDKRWSPDGWLGKASIMLYPPVNFSGSLFNDYLDTPCFGSRLISSLEVLNTSQFTYWDLDTFSYNTDEAFIGHQNRSIPRCHRRHAGNVCVVLAKVKLMFGICPRPVHFSLLHAVSHIARMSTHLYPTEHRPTDFDAHRRAPVPDGLDMRYDMCEAHVCESPDNCHEYHIENDGLKADGGIYINQFDTHAATYLETVCTFEVIGFLDEIWSPHIYFRQWVGFNWTIPD